MNFKLVCALLFLMVGILSTSGCISSGEGNNSTVTSVNASVNHYEGNKMSFDIPSSWNMYTFLDPWASFAIRNFTQDEISFLMVFSLENEANMSAQEFLMQTTSSPGQTIISQRNFTVDNASAYQIVVVDAGDNSSEYAIETTVVKNNRVYFFIMATNPLNLNQTQKDLDFILNSTRFK